VADLKSRASRWTRVVGEVKATEGDLLRLYDHFKPGVPEFAALLPPRWAVRLQRWDRARVARGLLPWALPIKVGTHSVLGMLGLRLLAACRRIRPLGSRYATEQSLIEQWLDAVVEGLREDRARVRGPGAAIKASNDMRFQPAACAAAPGRSPLTPRAPPQRCAVSPSSTHRARRPSGNIR
jgi:hypothetical protein